MCVNCKGSGYDKGIKCACQEVVEAPKNIEERERLIKEELVVYEWPDGAWCWKEELHEMTHRSDDYTLVFYNEEVHK